MPAVIPFIPLIVAGVGATASVISSKMSSNTAKRSADQALAYAKEQEAERRREWDIQSKAAQAQWDTQQANLAPYRAARAAILRKHGIDVPDVVAPKPPDFSAGPPPGWKSGDPLTPGSATAATSKPKSSGGGFGGALALGAIGGAATALPSLYEKYKMAQPQYGMASAPTNAGLSTGGVGYGMSPLTSPPPVIPTSGLSNWSGYGVPSQPTSPYYGE